MKFTSDIFDFFICLEKRLKQTLPGKEAHMQMAPSGRADLKWKIPFHAVKSAVLILLFPCDNRVKTIFIQRPQYNGIHSGQISFPGGKFEMYDTDLQQTALRETFEETGIDVTQVKILGSLSQLFIPPSNYVVTPYVGFVNDNLTYKPDPLEVDKIHEIPLSYFIDDSFIKEKVFGTIYKVHAPYYSVQGLEIWGATAMIISEFSEILKSLKCQPLVERAILL